MSRAVWSRRRGVEGATLALLSTGVMLSLVRGWDDSLAIGIQAVGFLVLGFITTTSRTYRWLSVGLGLLGLARLVGSVISISPPLSNVPVWVEIALGLALLIWIPALFIREHVAPTSEDFRAIEQAHKDAKRRERFQRSGEGIN